jgi:hypothetical protein
MMAQAWLEPAQRIEWHAHKEFFVAAQSGSSRFVERCLND